MLTLKELVPHIRHLSPALFLSHSISHLYPSHRGCSRAPWGVFSILYHFRCYCTPSPAFVPLNFINKGSVS